VEAGWDGNRLAGEVGRRGVIEIVRRLDKR
jgi:hypothetical protein